MYRIRRVDACAEEVAETLADLHLLTFFEAAAMRNSISDRGGSPIEATMRLPLQASSHPPAREIAPISPKSGSCSGIGAGDFSSG